MEAIVNFYAYIICGPPLRKNNSTGTLYKYMNFQHVYQHSFLHQEKLHSKEVIKMKNLRDNLMDSKKRMPMATLLKCEKVLKKLEIGKVSSSC